MTLASAAVFRPQVGQRVGGLLQAGLDVLAHLGESRRRSVPNNGAMSTVEHGSSRVEADCPICTGTVSTAHLEARDHVSGEMFSIHRCRACGGLFVKDPPDQARLTDYYDTPVGALMRSRPSSVFAALRARRLWADVRPLLELGRDPRIVDLGAGDGGLASLLARRGATVQAIDVYPHDQWEIEDVPYAPYSPGELNPDDLWVAGSRPDAVVMRHVLEHLPDPAATLATIREAGAHHVLVIVPNADSRLARGLGASWYYWDPPRHLTFFTLPTLARLVDRCGFRVAFARHYGLDELVTSAYRALLIRRLSGKGGPMSERLAAVIQPTGLIAGGASVVVGPLTRTVCHVVLEAKER